MITGLDSSIDRPTAAIADLARSQGIGFWCGYLTTDPLPGETEEMLLRRLGLIARWSQQDFDNARRCGGTPIGFCSGWDDPDQIRIRAAAWRVRAGLDDEIAIRADGPWVQPWLDASGAGLYGLLGIHAGRTAAFHIAALYPVTGCPGRSWPNPWPPAAPHGWQCQGTHQEFGLSVDRGVYDDWFGVAMLTQGQLEEIVDNWYVTLTGHLTPSDGDRQNWVRQILPDGSNVRLVRDLFAVTPEAQEYLAILLNLKATAGMPPSKDALLRRYLSNTPQ